MELTEATTELLQRRKLDLEYMASTFATENLAIPADVEEDMAALAEELARRGADDPPPPSWPDYLGLELGDFQLRELVGDGPFSCLLLAENDTGLRKVIKIARTAWTREPMARGNAPLTRALRIADRGISPLAADPGQLLMLQAEKLTAVEHNALVPIESISEIAGAIYLRMPVVDGESLDRLIADRRLPDRKWLSIAFTELAHNLQSLSVHPEFKCHGDIKPGNLMVTDTGLKLIDPGFFGPLSDEGSSHDLCAVTTPEYYPFLDGDDMTAFGLTLWECFAGVQPFAAPPADGDEAELQVLAAALRDRLDAETARGNYFAGPLATLRLPQTTNRELTGNWQKFLLRSIRLELDENDILCDTQGFSTFNELADALETLSKEGSQ